MFKLSLINAKKSFKNYSIYIITLACCIAFLFSVFIILQDEQINNPRLQRMRLFTSLFALAKISIICVLFWLINYMGKYILASRSKEFALYMLLGIENKNINILYAVEQLILSFISIILGLVLGALLYSILPKFIMLFLDLEYESSFFMPKEAVFKTIIIVFFIYIFYIVKSKFKFRNKKIIDLLNDYRKNEKIKIKKLSMPVVIFLFIAITSYFFILNAVKQDKLNNLYFLVFLIFALSIFGLSYFLPAFIFKLKTKSNNLYKQNNLALIFSISKLSNFSSKLGLISLLSLLALVAFNLGFMSLRFYALDKTGYDALYDLKLEHFQDSGDSVDNPNFDEDVSSLLNEKIGIKNEAVVSEYYDEQDEIQRNITKKDGVSIQKIISLSDYNQLRKMQGLKSVSLNSDEFILNIDFLVRNEKPVLENNLYPIFNKQYKPKSVFVLKINAVNSRFCIVIADSEIPKNIFPKRRKHFWNLKNNDDEVLNKALLEICRKLNRPIDVIEKNGKVYEIPDDEFSLKAKRIMEYKVTASAFIMVSFYIGLILLISAASILASTAASELPVNRYRYNILLKLGIEKKALYSLARRQVLLFFILPALVAIPAGIGISLLIINTYYIGDYKLFILKALIPQLLLFTFVFFTYYFMTYKLYKRALV